ncbi:MAG: tetratricopeptide repeat protein [Isosphaeraceae bacterium]
MKLPHWQDLVLAENVFPEPDTDESRIVLWLKSDRDASFQHWERIGTVARAEVTARDGLCATAATSIRAREWIGGAVGKILHGLRERKGNRSFTLPSGRSAEQCGERQADLLLVWASAESSIADETAIKQAWPQAARVERIGQNLYLVGGLGTDANRAKAAGKAAGSQQPLSEGTPREDGEKSLALARQAGDRHAEVMALTDLGVIGLNEGDPQRAINFLEQALALSRQLEDKDRECDILGNLGMALLAVRQPGQAWELFQHQLSYARAKGDPYAEKLALERLAIASGNLGDANRAIALYEQALAVTRRVRDRHQEANVLWQQGIQFAELGQRDLAIAKADEAVTLFKLLGKPQAGWYGAYLQKYRMGQLDDQPGDAAGGATGLSPHSYLGGSLVANAMAQQPAKSGAAQAKSGPGLLRMAMSATKAMANFVGSGFKTATPEIQRQRLQTCAACEHHTGLRCQICGCFTNVKSRLLHEDCPIGKWPA